MSHTDHEWRSLLLLVLLVLLLVLLLKGNNCTQKYYDPIWTGLFFRISFLRFWLFLLKPFGISLLCVFHFVAADERKCCWQHCWQAFDAKQIMKHTRAATHDTPHSNHSTDLPAYLATQTHTHTLLTRVHTFSPHCPVDKLNLCAN